MAGDIWVIRPLLESSPQRSAGSDLSAVQMTASKIPVWSAKAGHSFSAQVALELLDTTARGPSDFYEQQGGLAGWPREIHVNRL